MVFSRGLKWEHWPKMGYILLQYILALTICYHVSLKCFDFSRFIYVSLVLQDRRPIQKQTQSSEKDNLGTFGSMHLFTSFNCNIYMLITLKVLQNKLIN